MDQRLCQLITHSSTPVKAVGLTLALAAFPWTVATILARECDGCSPVLQKPSCVLLTFVTVHYPQCQSDSLCLEYWWAFFSCEGGGGGGWVSALCFIVCLRLKSGIIYSVSQPDRVEQHEIISVKVIPEKQNLLKSHRKTQYLDYILAWISKSHDYLQVKSTWIYFSWTTYSTNPGCMTDKKPKTFI